MQHGLVMERFRIRERIGSGGMGVVYRAFDERLERDVAVKEIAAADPERVLREAQAAARLNHPGIVTLYELGLEGECALLVSELVRGATLADARRAGDLSDRDLAEIGIDLCDALAHAHAQGVIHRDLKPQNVIVCDDGGVGRRAKLMDFGIAALAGAPTLTRTGEVLGTLAYMAPEQSEGLPAGPEADVYSLALTLYEAWAGQNPVAGRTPAATVRRIGKPVASLAAHRPDLPPALVEAIDACLRPDPLERPPVALLRRRLTASGSALRPERLLPASDGDQLPPQRARPLRRLAPVLALGALLIALAGPAGATGLALVIAVLALPALLMLPGAGALVPTVGGVLGVFGAAALYPAAAATAVHGAARAAAAGALGWCWMLVAGGILGAGPGAEVAAAPPPGWESSGSSAAVALLSPLLEPAALAAMLAFILAAGALGLVLATANLAVAAIGALLWAAGWAALLPTLLPAAGHGWALIVGLSAAAALAAEAVRRRDREAAPQLPQPDSAAGSHVLVPSAAPQPARGSFQTISSH